MSDPLCIVTRPAAQAGAAVADLQAQGLAAAALPLIDIEPADDPAPVHAAWATLPGCALVMFVSANAVQHFFAARPAAAQPWPYGVLAGCVGPGTASALRAAGVPAQAVLEPPAGPGRFDSEALWALLADRHWQGRRVIVVRGEDGRDWLADTLRAHGAQVDFIAAYRRLPPRPDAQGRALLAAAQAAPTVHLWLFSSSEAVCHLQALAPAADWSQGRALASHPRILAAARAAGFADAALSPLTAQAVAAWLRGGPVAAAAQVGADQRAEPTPGPHAASIHSQP